MPLEMLPKMLPVRFLLAPQPPSTEGEDHQISSKTKGSVPAGEGTPHTQQRETRAKTDMSF